MSGRLRMLAVSTLTLMTLLPLSGAAHAQIDPGLLPSLPALGGLLGGAAGGGLLGP